MSLIVTCLSSCTRDHIDKAGSSTTLIRIVVFRFVLYESSDLFVLILIAHEKRKMIVFFLTM